MLILQGKAFVVFSLMVIMPMMMIMMTNLRYCFIFTELFYFLYFSVCIHGLINTAPILLDIQK